MTVRPAVVVLGWMIANLVLVGVLFLFGEMLLAQLLYLCSSAIILAFALTVLRAPSEASSAQQHVRLPAGMGYSAVAAAGILLIGLGLIFADWISGVGLLVLLGALLGLWRSRRTPQPPRLEPPRE